MPKKKKPVDPQKAALYELLQKRLGPVEFDRKIDQIRAPIECTEPSDFPLDYRKIVKALCNHRGRNGFCNVLPRSAKMECDFVIEDCKLIVEYDERQHFTAPRKIALQNYPSDIVLHYSVTDWIKCCDKIDAHDNDPIYRDEQRAFYDSVRDIEAFRNGWTLLRIKDGDIDWTSANLETLDNILNHARYC